MEYTEKEKARKIFESMSDTEKLSFLNVVKETQDTILNGYEIRRTELEEDIKASTQREQELYEIQRTNNFIDLQGMNISEQTTSLRVKRRLDSKELLNIQNIITALKNAGSITEITDKNGYVHPQVADFRNINTDFIIFDEDNILSSPLPAYVPIINEDIFRDKGYVFDAIRVEKDAYVLSVSEYKEENFMNPSSSPASFVLVTLDQLVLISDYYYTKARAMAIKVAEERNQRSEDHYNTVSIERRQGILNQKNYWTALPASVKKKITQPEYEALSFEEKEKLYKPFKKYNPERLKSKLDSHHMYSSFHSMYQRFLNPTAYPKDRKGNEIKDGKPAYGQIANSEVWSYWSMFREMMEYKMKDIRIQREDLSESYKTAIETSFGEINTSMALKEKYGILVKRQNGDQINPYEIQQIEDGYVAIQKVFGNLKNISNEKNLKISHTGKKMVFGSGRSIGVYIPSMGTIAVSDKYGTEQFQSTFSHEVAHFIDNYIGELHGNRYATDDYEGTAGILAFTFRNRMNKPKSLQTDYINSTKECFARALQQYFSIETNGEEGGIAHSEKELDKIYPYFLADNFVGKESYISSIKPLVEKFLSENQDVFKFTVDLENNTAPVAISSTKSSGDDIFQAIEALKLLLEVSDETESAEIMEAIEALQLLEN